MKHVVIDLEMNSMGKKHTKERKICGREVAQIGAVMTDENFKPLTYSIGDVLKGIVIG